MSSAMLSAIEAMKDFNSVLRAEMDKPVKVSLPKGPLDPSKIKIEVVRNHNSKKLEVVAFYKDGKLRRLIKLDREHDDYTEADKDARWVRRQVKHGQMILQFPEV